MANAFEYKCSSCGGAMEFDSATQKLICPYCGAVHDAAEYDAMQQQEQSAAAGMAGGQSSTQGSNNWSMQQDQWNVNEEGLYSYVCESCGGEIVGDENTAATSCPYCDSPIIRNSQFSGSLKPDYIIPFKLDKKAAKAKLNNFVSGKKLVPRVFKDQKHIEEIKGVYVPFWVFDADVYAQVQYDATREQASGNQIEEGHFDVFRGGNLSFRGIPVDASSKMEDELMDSIAPFNNNEAVAFTPAYLAGYMADKYDVSREESFLRVDEMLKNSVSEAMAGTVQGFHSVQAVATNVNLLQGNVSYALYPVWILNTKWQGKQYRFAMNGQTGKFVGDLPYDKGAYKRQLFMFAGIIAAVIFVVLFLAWLIFR